MPTEIVPVTPERMPAVRRFVERVWQRPRSEAYYRWRYESVPFHRGWVALRDGECLAMQWALQRPYRVGAETIDFLEVFDWYAAPELRGVGLGVRVQQALMREREPLLLVGGTADTQSLLPRLGWRVVAEAERFLLPIGPERLAAAIGRRARLPAPLASLAARAVLALPGRRPRVRALPRDGRVVPVACVGEEALALAVHSDAGMFPLWTQPLLAWLRDFPANGHQLPLYFEVAGALAGWALARIFPTTHGCDAEILDLVAPEADVDLQTWMLSELVLRIAAFGPQLVTCSTSCERFGAALRRNGFITAGRDPVQIWWPARATLPAPIRIGSNSGDRPLLPYPERWWDAVS